MNNDNWLEWIGIWGSGKSTKIEKIKNEIQKDLVYQTTSDFFKLNKYRRLSITLINISRTPLSSAKLLNILLPKYFKGLFLRDQILKSELRSFWYCYSARLYSVFKGGSKLCLWEGEFHLIPFLDLNIRQKETITNLLLNLTKARSVRFIVLDISIINAIDRIEKDQKSGKKTRFTKTQYLFFKRYIANAFNHQEELINILEKRGEKIFKIDSSDHISSEEIFSNINK